MLNTIERYHRLFVLAFTLITLTTGVLLFDAFSRGITIDTDLRALLPEDNSLAISQITSDRFYKHVNNKLVVVISTNNLSIAQSAANQVVHIIDSHPTPPLRVKAALDERSLSILDELKPYRFHLLSPQQRQLIQNNPKQLIEEAQHALFSLGNINNTSSFSEDPLNLFNGYIQSINTNKAGLNYSPPFLFVERENKAFVILFLEVEKNALNLDVQEKVSALFTEITSMLQQKYPSVELINSGMMFHAAQAAATAKIEIAYITSISILGIVLLYIIAFRSLTPLALSLLSITVGWLCAFAFCHYIFHSLHIITLVFGATLIGVSIDYSLHYFSKLYATPHWENKFRPLGSIFSAIALGLTTSILGYGSLVVAPLPGLSQVAVFSVIGLLCSWLFVVTLYPWIRMKHRQPVPNWLMLFSFFPQRGWAFLTHKPLFALCLVLVLGLIASGTMTKFSDNPRLLHIPSPELLENDKQVRQLLQQFNTNQFIVVTATTEQGVLEKEEHLTSLLQAGYEMKDFRSVTQYLPSIQIQRENYRLLDKHLYQNNGPLVQFLTGLGFDSRQIEKYIQDFNSASGNYITPSQWTNIASEELSLMWLGKIDQLYASVVLLGDISDPNALQHTIENIDGIFLINNGKRLQQILSEQQQASFKLLIIAYLVVTAVLLFRYRKWQAASIVLVPLTSSLITLAILGACDIPITLFHTFSLFLILGLGLDYAIFIYESGQTQSSAHLAVMLSALTSCLSFGLLAMSQTPMVSNLGVAILIGSLFNLVLAPLVAQVNTKPKERDVTQ